MTQPPIQPQYYNPPLPSGRPTSVTVLAIIGIIFGAFGVLCTPLALMPYFVSGVSHPAIDGIKNDPKLFSWLILSTVIGWVFAVLLLASSIGALSLKKWARQGLVVYGVAAIIMGIIGFIINMMWLFPKMAELQAGTPQARGAMMGGMAGGVIGLVIGLALPILLLYFMTRPHVIAAFENAPQPAA